MLIACTLTVPMAAVTVGAVPGPMPVPPAAAAPAGERTTIVQLFQWPWRSVASECENVLGPKGFGAVQISPPHEHIVLDRPGDDHEAYPWWQDYQPVSYPYRDDAGQWQKFRTRRGDVADFQDMIGRCHAAGVKIYADVIANHMTGSAGAGRGSAGSTFTTKYAYSGLYGNQDFNDCRRDIADGDYTSNGWAVQNCELVGLADLKTGSQWVQRRVGQYLKDLASLGVDGFRMDAAKHIPPGDIKAMLDQMRAQIAADPGFDGTRDPYVYQEVLYGANEAITPGQYRGNGDLKAVQVGDHLSAKFWNASTREDGIHGLHAYPNGWGDQMEPSSGAIVMIDNHDSQRDALPSAAGGRDRRILTYKDGAKYRLANVFMLGWDHGTPLVMSSFAFGSRNTSPPREADGTTKQVRCDGTEWVCEHRWSEIADMVGFRNAVAGTTVNKTLPQPEQDWYTDYSEGGSGGKIAFSRGAKGYVVINRDEGSGWNRTYKTRLPAGTYCNVIDGDYDPRTRTCGNGGNLVEVRADGTFTANVPPMSALAIHVGALHEPGDPGGDITVTHTITAHTAPGENVYVVGDIAELGGWDPAEAVKLGTGEAAYPVWTGRVTLKPGTSVEYKYIKKHDGEVVWEQGANRAFTTPASGDVSRADGTFRGDSRVTGTYRVQAHTHVGQNVYVVGNVAELGGWDPAKAVKLDTGQAVYPRWQGRTALPPNTRIEYKYLIKEDGEAPVWEQGANRAVTTPGDGEHVFEDGWFRS